MLIVQKGANDMNFCDPARLRWISLSRILFVEYLCSSLRLLQLGIKYETFKKRISL